MRRLILAVPPDEGGRIRLRGKDGRYLSRVLRLGPGDSFRVLLPDGREAQASVLSAGKDIVEAAVAREADAAASLVADRKRKAATVRTPPIVLLQALPKGQKMDLIVRQATEAGVAVIIPFVSDHSVSRPEEADASRKKERWERIAKEARQQSGSDVPTEILAPRGLREALDAWRGFAEPRAPAAAIFLHQDPLAQGSFHGYLSGDPAAVAVAVGPEGGFSRSEAAALADAGFLPALLGENVLRTETAAVYALAATQVILLEKASWIPKTPTSPESNA